MRNLAWMALCCVWISFGAAAAEQAEETTSKDLPGLTYKSVNLQFGGFLASEMVYRSNNTASDIGTTYSKLPFTNSAGYGMSEFRGTERQSRFSLLAQSDYESTHLAGYYEVDFLGTSPTANANESNSYTPRTRNVYMTLDWENCGLHILAGQNWSLVTLNSNGITPRTEYIPQTIDAQYAVGFNWERQWQLRVVKDWDKTLWAALSLENAQTVGLGGTQPANTGNTYQLPPGSNMDANMSFNSFPDVIAKFAWDSSFGHYEAFNLLRNFQSRFGGTTVPTQTNKQSSWTEAVGAGGIIPVWPNHIDLSLNGLYGQGIGRYGTAGLSDVTYAGDGSLLPLSGLQYLAQVTWHAGHGWEVYAAYGQETVNAAVGGNSDYGYGDGVVASNSGCTFLGGNCAPNLKSASQANVGFWWTFYKGGFGATKLGLQYSHTTLDTYADATGLAPSTTEDMLFTSLRFYPF